MSRMKTVSKLLLAIFMVGAGTMHFVNPDFYVKIMPQYLPRHRELVYLSGLLVGSAASELLQPKRSDEVRFDIATRERGVPAESGRGGVGVGVARRPVDARGKRRLIDKPGSLKQG